MASKSFIYALLVSLWAVTNCSLLVPQRYHCISQIYQQASRPDGKVSNERVWSSVEEYVDLDENRSSLRLEDLQTSKSKIYYNEVTQSGRRNLVVFDPDIMTCETAPENWPLAKVKILASKLMPIRLHEREPHDTAIGPSALLLAIEETLDDFHYVTTRFSSRRLVEVDVYERILRPNSRLVSITKTLLISISVLSQGENSEKEWNLAQMVRHKRETDLLSITVLEPDEEKLKIRPIKTEYPFNPSEAVFFIEFDEVTRMITGSLIGQTLEQTSEFNYQRDPFLKPIGIGCIEVSSDSSEDKIFNAPGVQFSAEYKTDKGFKGLSYVAYDGQADMLRLDREGRKSVYDLRNRMSYNIDEYNSYKQISNNIDHTKNCIPMDISDPLIRPGFMLTRLLRVGMPGKAAAFYLGPKLIDHVSYEVYELELRNSSPLSQDYNLPILMETTGFLMPSTESPGRRFFLTYYVQELLNRPDICLLKDKYAFGLNNVKCGNSVLIPKFIELWELKGRGKIKRRSLINRLEFTEFNWSLDVEPSGDPDSQDLSRLFNIESCYHEKSKQLKLRFRVTPDESTRQRAGSIDLIEAYEINSLNLRQSLHSQLARLLTIPRVNIAQIGISLASQKSPILVVEAKIAELNSIVMNNQFLGYIRLTEILRRFQSSFISAFYNRHSIELCWLDSMNAKVENVPMYCQGLTLCILIKREDSSELPVLQQADNNKLRRSANISETLCEVNSFTWATRPIDASKLTPVLSRVEGEKFHIDGNWFEFDLTYPGGGTAIDNSVENQLSESFRYRGSGGGVEVKSMDASGVGSPITGLRYTTMQEEPTAPNMNLALKLKSKSMDSRFKHCQLACQFEEMCQSFSFCRQYKTNKQNEPDNSSPDESHQCILSSLRVTGQRQLTILDALGKEPKNDLELKISTEHQSQVFKLKHDSECGIHPKDIDSFYELYKFYVSDWPRPLAKKLGEPMSLDECVGLNHEALLWAKPVNSTFFYCPLSSICIRDPLTERPQMDVDRVCYRYKKTSLQFYNAWKLARLTIKLAGEQYQEQQNSSKKLDKAAEARRQLQHFKIGRWLGGLDEEQCARECNLHQSHCLAFDSCRSVNGFTNLYKTSTSSSDLCILYSIRSPASGFSRRIGLLPQERQFYAQAGEEGASESKVSMTGSLVCNHYELKGAYLDIRLGQMSEPERTATQVEPSKLNEIESSIIVSDQEESKQFLDDTEEINRRQQQADDERADEGRKDRKIHIAWFTVGLLLGYLCTVYASSLTIYLLDQWEALKVRRARRFGESRISHVELTNNNNSFDAPV